MITRLEFHNVTTKLQQKYSTYFTLDSQLDLTLTAVISAKYNTSICSVYPMLMCVDNSILLFDMFEAEYLLANNYRHIENDTKLTFDKFEKLADLHVRKYIAQLTNDLIALEQVMQDILQFEINEI